MNVPDAIAHLVPSLFDSDEKPLYAQAATTAPDGAPNVRTVHVRYLQSADALCFACHVESPKWRELQSNSRIAACWFHPKRQIQLRWHANATLITDRDHPAVQTSWEQTHEWIQKEYEDGSFFGVVVLAITSWDFYEIDLTDPSKSRRRVWILDGKNWREESRQTLK